MAVVASVFKVGWCLMSSSTALPKLDAVSPKVKHTTCFPLKQFPQNEDLHSIRHTIELTQWIGAASPSHCRQVVRGQKHFEEALKWLALYKGVQASCIQAQSTEHIGERTQNLTCSRNLKKKKEGRTLA